MNHFPLRTILVFSIIISFHPAIYAKDLTKKELKEKIINAWLENSAKIDSYRFKYELEFTYHKGMANYYYLRQNYKDQTPLPVKTITTKQYCEFVANQSNQKNVNYGNEFNFFTNKIMRNADVRIVNKNHQFIFVHNPFLKKF